MWSFYLQFNTLIWPTSGSAKVQFQHGPGEIPSVRSDLKNPYSWCEVLTDTKIHKSHAHTELHKSKSELGRVHCIQVLGCLRIRGAPRTFAAGLYWLVSTVLSKPFPDKLGIKANCHISCAENSFIIQCIPRSSPAPHAEAGLPPQSSRLITSHFEGDPSVSAM